MSPNRQRVVKVSRELLMEMLKFPAETRLVGVSDQFDFFGDTIALKVEHPDFTPVEPGAVIPEVSAEYRGDAAGVPQFLGFRPVVAGDDADLPHVVQG